MRKISTKLIVFLILFFVIVVPLGTLYWYLTRGVLVHIQNESQRTIYIIDVYYRYGSTGPIKIDEGKSFDVVLGSNAQDYLIIQYLGKDNVEKYKPVYAYHMSLYRNWGYGIRISIDSNDVVTNEIVDLSTGSKISGIKPDRI
jgi:hypothetical protein